MSQRNRGFSLVEILVVVAIVMVLLAFLFPVVTMARETARRTVCVSNLHQIGLACQAYAGDNRSYFPYGAGSVSPDPLIPKVVAPGYIENPRILYCPSARYNYYLPWFPPIYFEKTYPRSIGYYYFNCLGYARSPRTLSHNPGWTLMTDIASQWVTLDTMHSLDKVGGIYILRLDAGVTWMNGSYYESAPGQMQ
jgi:prepilin-type N-terminal cleavage/methylation domain-containing protein